MVLVVVVCLGFGSSQHLTNAYGLAGAPFYPINRSRYGDVHHNHSFRIGNVLCVALYLRSTSVILDHFWDC
jgi:hypothetical protein